jgi:hypothetical protein
VLDTLRPGTNGNVLVGLTYLKVGRLGSPGGCFGFRVQGHACHDICSTTRVVCTVDSGPYLDPPPPLHACPQQSYEHMGFATVACESGCNCTRATIAAHHDARHSQTYQRTLEVSQSERCAISVTVEAVSLSGEHKFKVRSVQLITLITLVSKLLQELSLRGGGVGINVCLICPPVSGVVIQLID